MKQILVLSGKGGTGKTVLTGALAALVENKVMVDCDVDAANLHLLLTPKIIEKHTFKSGKKARIDQNACLRCGKCRELCRFGAVTKDLLVDTSSCEGCGLCARICPAQAINMEDNVCGEWYVSETRYGCMVHARLGIGEDNSGKLVAQIRHVANEIALKGAREWIIIDGPPGIGCPAIASLCGVDSVLLVTEPTCSGLHDTIRVIDLVKHFKIPVQLVVNKWDINPAITEQFASFCLANGIIMAGRIPFDRAIVDGVVGGKTIMEGSNEFLKEIIRKIWISLARS
jgi:MinD superfamily P-loop ATPase